MAEVFTKSDAARELGTTYQRIQYALAAGWLHGVENSGGNPVITRRELEKFRKRRPRGLKARAKATR